LGLHREGEVRALSRKRTPPRPIAHTVARAEESPLRGANSNCPDTTAPAPHTNTHRHTHTGLVNTMGRGAPPVLEHGPRSATAGRVCREQASRRSHSESQHHWAPPSTRPDQLVTTSTTLVLVVLLLLCYYWCRGPARPGRPDSARSLRGQEERAAKGAGRPPQC